MKKYGWTSRFLVLPLMPAALCIFILVLFVSCTAKPHPRIYHLGIMDPPIGQKTGRIPVVLLESPSLPRHLDRPQMVTRAGASELIVHEHHRWAAPIDRLIRESLAARMDARSHDFRIIPSELASAYSAPLLRIGIQLLDFSADSHGEIRLSGIFFIKSPRQNMDEIPFDIRVVTPSLSPEALVASQSLALDGLSEMMLAELTPFIR